MPTIFSHAIFAAAVGTAVRSDRRLPAGFWLLTILCAVLPDLDVVAFAFGIRYEGMLGHRGITHSIAFALLIGVITARFFFPEPPLARWKLALYFSAITASHPVLDMLTDGGLGVALLAPFSNMRFFFPWRPIEVSPIGRNFLSERGLAVIASEVLWIWIPSLLIVLGSWLFRYKRGMTHTE